MSQVPSNQQALFTQTPEMKLLREMREKIVLPSNLNEAQLNILKKRLKKLYYLLPVIELTLEEFPQKNKILSDTETVIESVVLFSYPLLKAVEENFLKYFVNATKLIVIKAAEFSTIAKKEGNALTNTAEYQAWKNNFDNFVFELRMAGFMPYAYGREVAETSQVN